ncbi:Vat family streptogramin A O-acetyltransferase [Paenibacillus sp. MMS20-IR301]|uniref:Vat family streptogramin A O-acetyltransferase n=1 Tax=Paenibacillus sp. MMS20-IR301 TaxID=2895946 RepID=UPI0028EADB38|nr:Vat family streptogramin A O-acetyltransferase [Paenibacillus sp. MMS20-IR301]WNS42376.1 Vat family streptogramin A O-acetyltransferase [Paenibacillus sp. MMS20-IR301]
MQPIGPDADAIHPNPLIKQVRFIKNTVTRAGIIAGDYSYYDDPDESVSFESRVTHHYDFIGDKLIIGKFCAIARGTEFIMNGANHRMGSVTTYPFNIMGGGWEKAVPELAELPYKGDTVIGNDVWIGQNATIMPGVTIGDGAIIAANATVTRDVPPYHIAGGNPARVLRQRFSDELIQLLLKLRWWDWSAEKITANLEVLCSSDLERIKGLAEGD